MELINQLHDRTLILTCKSFTEIYYPIQNSVTVNIENELNFPGVKKLILKFHDKFNIIIDSRLEYIIITTELHFPGYTLIYNISNHKVCKFVVYFTPKLSLNLSFLYLRTNDGRKLIDLFVFINYVCKNLSIVWNVDSAIQIASISNNIVELVLNYIKIHRFELIDDGEKNKLMSSFIQVITNKFEDIRSPIFENIDKLFTILMILNNSKIYVKMYQ